MKYYECKTCGNIIVLFEDSGVTPVCCGSTMVELMPQDSDGSYEKHVPVIETNGDEIKITVGEQLHPMLDEHYIKWIVLETDKGKYIRDLKPGQEPIVIFKLWDKEVPQAAYEYCSVHSLWGKKYEKKDNS